MTVKFFSTNCEDVGYGNSSIDLKQVTKLNIEATPDNPHTSTIDIDFDSKFKRLPVEVLRVEGNEKGVIEVLADFDNSDKSDFIDNPFVEFDGVMKIKTDYNFKFIDNDDFYSFNLKELNIFGDEIDSIKCIEEVI